jgi:hypothetical protein
VKKTAICEQKTQKELQKIRCYVKKIKKESENIFRVKFAALLLAKGAK